MSSGNKQDLKNMEIYLLLDTNILKRLVSKTEFGFHLLQLDHYIRKGHIMILVPETLKTEWHKHKEIERKAILSVINDLEKEHRTMRLMKDSATHFQFETIEELKMELLSQLEMIDDLLFNYGIAIKISDSTIIKVHNQRTANKKPFDLSGKDHTNDALIIFQALEYLQSNIKPELYFVSHNTAQFATEQETSLIHPHISLEFPAIKIHYYTAIADVYQAFNRLNIPGYKITANSNKIKNVIPVDRSKTVLDQLYEYISRRSDQLLIIPKQILNEHYPVIISDSFSLHHKPNTLVTDNRAIFELLSGVEIGEEALSYEDNPFISNAEDEEKLRVIFKYLHLNLITKVAFKDGDGKNIKYSPAKSKCDCALCLFKKMEFSASLAGLNNEAGTVSDPEKRVQFILRDIYSHYKLGNFFKAAKLLGILYEERKEVKDLYTYIIAFNLHSLGFIMRHFYWENGEAHELSETLRGIDLEAVYRRCKTYANKELVEWIHEKKFYDDTFSLMHEKVRSISDHFYGRNSGFNDNTISLIEYYYSVDNFLNLNYIMYDIFSDFKSLSNLFIEGLLASYGCDEYMGGKLLHFSDRLLETLLFKGDAREIKKYFDRYKLKGVKYCPNQVDSNRLLERLSNTFRDYNLTNENHKLIEEKNNGFFWDQYDQLINNALILFAVTDFKQEEINQFTELLIRFLKKQSHVNAHNLLDNLRYFLFEKRDQLYPKVLRECFIEYLENDFFQRENYIQTLSNIFIVPEYPDCANRKGTCFF